MLVLHDKATLLHKTKEILGAKLIDALESPERIEAILNVLQDEVDESHELREIDSTEVFDSLESSGLWKLLTTTHDKDYINHLASIHESWVKAGHVEPDGVILPECFRFPHDASGSKKFSPPVDLFARVGYYAFDLSSGISADSWTSIVASANLALEAAKELLIEINGEDHVGSTQNDVLALCRPPGHHCNGELAGGYCYVNNAVIAVESLRNFAKPASVPPEYVKIAILDIDFHHGNGTQDYFYSDPSVMYVSIHGRDEYPYYSGYSEETGEGEGVGANLNLPLTPGAPVEEYLANLDVAITTIISHKPEYLVVSLGFDTFRLDPLGKFELDSEDYRTIGNRIRKNVQLKSVPAIILLEGGYVIDRLGENLLCFLAGWENDEAL